jgi:hypothetical protein
LGVDGLAKFPRVKLYLSEMDDVVPRSIWNYGDVGHTQQATNEIKELFSGEQVFDTPKPLKLLRRIVQLSSNKNDDIILDFLLVQEQQLMLFLNKTRKMAFLAKVLSYNFLKFY